MARAARRREFAYKSRRRRTNFLIPKKKTPHPQTKGRGALHSTRCHPNSVFLIKTALFLSVTWTNPGLSAMTPFGRHSHFHPSQFRSQPARNERTKPLFASGNNPLRRSTSFFVVFFVDLVCTLPSLRPCIRFTNAWLCKSVQMPQAPLH